MYEVKEIHDFPLWEQFVKESPQGTLFSSPKWCCLFPDPFVIYGCFKGNELQGGLIGFNTSKGFFSGGYPCTQFQGIITKPGFESKYGITEALISVLPAKSTVVNSYYATDIRPFLWADWKPLVRYTYLIQNPDLSKLEKDTRYDITHNSDTVTAGDIFSFYKLYEQTFKRKGLPVPVTSSWMLKFYELFEPAIKTTEHNAALIIQDDKRAYYLFGASDGSRSSAKVVWETIKDHKEVDTVGANSRDIALYKRGFGGVLTPYLGATNV
ncbi:MAG: hypothetical protein IMZ61_06450 [Planctomycetes bacterium]|nr:hypothetical protein [Planctomycetota bacterium]